MMDRLTKLKKLRKKEKAPKKFKGTGLRIVDEDDFLSGRGSKDSDSDDQEADELPQIAAVLDDRPVEVKALEQFNQQNKWKTFSSVSDNLPVKPSGTSSFSKSGESSDSDSDSSLPRRKHGNSSDDTVSEGNSRGSPLPSLSGPRHGKTNLSKDLSPPRRKQHDSDLSPPRRRQQDTDLSPPRRKRQDSDLSPPRRKRQDSDLSPPRRKRQDSDLSPPRRKRKDSDLSPPRKGRNGSDFSPRRNRSQELDLSPPRRKRHDSDLSPPRRKQHKADFSPPRRNRQTSDFSPPRREKRSESSSFRNNNSRDSQSSSRSQRSYRDQEVLSPPRLENRYVESRSLELESGETDLSPPRKRRYDKVRRRRTAPQIIENSEQDNEAKTLGGKKAGLQKGNALKQEMDELRRKEDEMFANLDDSVTGRNAKTRIGAAKERALAEERAKKQEDEKFASERKKQYDKWGKGLKQVEDQAALVESVLHEIAKPLARSKDDEDLDAHLRSIDRDGDPMLKFITKKKGKGGDKPKYNGPAPPPNRFHIPPGYRWDGVDRSNGYEKQWFGRINARKALQEESYKWSVEDL